MKCGQNGRVHITPIDTLQIKKEHIKICTLHRYILLFDLSFFSWQTVMSRDCGTCVFLGKRVSLNYSISVLTVNSPASLFRTVYWLGSLIFTKLSTYNHITEIPNIYWGCLFPSGVEGLKGCVALFNLSPIFQDIHSLLNLRSWWFVFFFLVICAQLEELDYNTDD